VNFNGIDICCPHCRGALEGAAEGPDGLRCAACERCFPVIAGIPDLRVFPDPYIDVEADRAKGLKLAGKLKDLSFPELIDYYYTTTTVVPPKHAKLYARGLLAAGARAEAALDSWQRSVGDTARGSAAATSRVLEIGCGTAPLLVAAAPRFATVVGVDIAFRWLVVAKKRLEEAGLDLPLICACAEALPFPDESFDRVFAESALEVVQEQPATLRESHRVLRPGGALCISTPNRFSIGPDPHTGVWGGSWLPDALTAAIVRKQGGIPPKRRLLSAASLRRSIRAAGFTSPTVTLPDVPEGQRSAFTGLARVAVNGYRLARRLPVSSHLLRLIGPMLHAVATKPSAADRAATLEPALAAR
jgi:SAM-dependent methyltransferase